MRTPLTALLSGLCFHLRRTRLPHGHRGSCTAGFQMVPSVNSGHWVLTPVTRCSVSSCFPCCCMWACSPSVRDLLPLLFQDVVSNVSPQLMSGPSYLVKKTEALLECKSWLHLPLSADVSRYPPPLKRATRDDTNIPGSYQCIVFAYSTLRLSGIHCPRLTRSQSSYGSTGCWRPIGWFGPHRRGTVDGSPEGISLHDLHPQALSPNLGPHA